MSARADLARVRSDLAGYEGRLVLTEEEAEHRERLRARVGELERMIGEEGKSNG